MRRFHKLLSLLLALVIVLGVFAAAPLTAYAAEPQPFSAHGKCGVDENSDVEWYSFDDMSMVIFGTGDMHNFSIKSDGTSSAPWYSYDTSLIVNTVMATKIAVEYGVTSIGDYSFFIADNYMYQSFIQLRNIDIANTVTSIGKYAFYNQQIEEVVIPPSVTYIGENAFKNCRYLKKISYFGDPEQLVWDTDAETDTEFYGKNIECHILEDYKDREDAINERFAYKHLTFVADMENPYEGSGEELTRNIALYYGSANSKVFGGAAPYIIVGTFDGKKKSVTHGSNGFASCVYDSRNDGEYYILTDTTKGTLNLATIANNGRVSGYTANHDALKLHIKHQYIGINTVKVIYQLENTSDSTVSGLKLGGTGDIKIGADDFASIEPLNEDGSQIGFYMKSTKEYDRSGDGDNAEYATLGFIGDHVEKTAATEGHPATYYDNATFFYGEAAANASASASGTKTVTFMPERVFKMNSGKSQSSGTFAGTENGVNRDSGMSYYWDNISLVSGETKEFAVLFSVYGTNEEEGSAESMITDLSQTFHTVTWENYDGTALLKTPVKHETTSPAYTGTPEKAYTEKKEYVFSGWKKVVGGVTDDVVYTNEQAAALTITADTTFIAQYNELERYFFKKHSLSIDGDIGVNYYVDVTCLPEGTVQKVKNGELKVKIKYHWYDKNAEYELGGSDYQETGFCAGLFKAKCSVNAAEMAYDIHATAYYSTGNDNTWTEYQDEHDIYSVREYGKVILDSTSDFSKMFKTEYGDGSYTKLRDLMIRTLDYGAKAQLAFDRKTNDLANNIFPTYGVNYQMEPLTADDISSYTPSKTPMKTSGDAVGLTFAGSSVLYLSNTSIRHYFTVDEKVLTTEEAVTNTFDTIKGNSPGFTYSPKDHGYYFEFSGIPAAKLNEQKTLTINGVEYKFSVLNYSQMVLDSTLPQADKDLAIATVWYNQAAIDYFNN